MPPDAAWEPPDDLLRAVAELLAASPDRQRLAIVRAADQAADGPREEVSSGGRES
jgi:hypothetical protein